MEQRLICLSESAAIDQSRNTLSLFHIHDSVSAVGFPISLSPAVLICSLVRTKDEPNQASAFLIIRHNEVQIGVFEVTLQFQEETHLRVVNNLQGLAIPGPGIFSISIKVGEVEFPPWKITVMKIGTQGDLFQSPLISSESQSTEPPLGGASSLTAS